MNNLRICIGVSKMNTNARLGWITWILVTAWLVYRNQVWELYDIFTIFSIGSAAVIEVFQHYFNSKFNSPIGQPYKAGDNK
jgi:hypothetical protein